MKKGVLYLSSRSVRHTVFKSATAAKARISNLNSMYIFPTLSGYVHILQNCG